MHNGPFLRHPSPDDKGMKAVCRSGCITSRWPNPPMKQIHYQLGRMSLLSFFQMCVNGPTTNQLQAQWVLVAISALGRVGPTAPFVMWLPHVEIGSTHPRIGMELIPSTRHVEPNRPNPGGKSPSIPGKSSEEGIWRDNSEEFSSRSPFEAEPGAPEEVGRTRAVLLGAAQLVSGAPASSPSKTWKTRQFKWISLVRLFNNLGKCKLDMLFLFMISLVYAWSTN